MIGRTAWLVLGTMTILCAQSELKADGITYAFDLRFQAQANLFSFPVNSPATQTQIGPVGGLDYFTFAMDWNTSGSTLHIVDHLPGAPNRLGTLDPVTGAFTAGPTITGSAAALASPTGLSVDPTDETFYLSSGTDLYTVDPNTGASALVGSFLDPAGAPVGTVIDIAIDNSGNMFAHDITSDRLWAVDKATGASVARPNSHGLNANFAQGMDFDPTTDILYAAIYVSGGVGSYGSWDTTTGVFTEILPLAAFPDPTPNGRELEMAIRIPEPSGLVLVLFSILGLVGAARRAKRG